MIRFNCDYSEGAHERILKKLAETNLEQTPGYGEDHYCTEAADIIRRLCGQEDAAVHFLVGGTQANMTVIASALRSHQGVVGAVTAHINVHETGSIEATGHKVLALPSEDGKITAAQVEELYQSHIQDESFEHTVQPKMVYVSNPTELGTIYTKAEMESLYGVCRKYGLYLFVDGARLAYGLAAEGNDLDLKALAASCDVFYIGGTKVGALFGEAVVILNNELWKTPLTRYSPSCRIVCWRRGRISTATPTREGWMRAIQPSASAPAGLPARSRWMPWFMIS